MDEQKYLLKKYSGELYYFNVGNLQIKLNVYLPK